jgi:ATP/maltotriose-dependent transcriptional regulator MalT
MAYWTSIWALQFCEAHQQAREAIEDGMDDSIARGSAFDYAGLCWMRSALSIVEGDLPGAEADARASVEHAFPTLVEMAHSALARVLLEQGNLPEAADVLERSGISSGTPSYSASRLIRGAVLLMTGRATEALEDFTEIGRSVKQMGGFAAGFPWQLLQAVARAALGQLEAAREAADEHLARTRKRETPIAEGSALRVCGLLASDSERVARLSEAVDVLASTTARLDLAKARFDLGVTLLRAGKRTQGRDLLRASCDAARSCGARRLAEVAYEELRVSGARPRRLSFSGVESLTASERRVAELAARGMSNREIAQTLFVTPKTVENHLGRCYMKLAVTSRHELTRALESALGGT